MPGAPVRKGTRHAREEEAYGYFGSQDRHVDSCSSIHFFAASSGDSFWSAMSRETSFWSSVVHLKFFRKAAALPPFFEKSALRYFWSGVFG